jgi:uncharacterized protein YbaR (Trm112 family)
MSNQITIEATKFVNVKGDGETLGFRMYDDYGQTYCNTLESIPDDDLDLLRLVLDNTDDISAAMFEHIKDNESDICINGEYYGWKTIKPILCQDELTDEEMVAKDMFKCEHCGKWFDIEDSVKLNSGEYWCVECDKTQKRIED